MSTATCTRWSSTLTTLMRSRLTIRRLSRAIWRMTGTSCRPKRLRTLRPKSQKTGMTGRRFLTPMIRNQRSARWIRPRNPYFSQLPWILCVPLQYFFFFFAVVVVVILGLGQAWEHPRSWCQEAWWLGWRDGWRVGAPYGHQPWLQGRKHMIIANKTLELSYYLNMYFKNPSKINISRKLLRE